MKKTTMRESMLTPRLFKIVSYTLIVGFIVIVILPFLPIPKIEQISYGFISLYCFGLADWMCTLFQRKSRHFVFCLVSSVLISFIICILLDFYAGYITTVVMC